jgi:hypothetical protein
MKGITGQLKQAMENAQREISANAAGGKYGAGLACEGYAGGYLAALHDVHAAMRGLTPSSHFWPQDE